MSDDGHWWFYQVENNAFPAVEARFDEAARGLSDMRDVLIHDAPPGKALFDGKYMYEVSWHEPFHNFAYQLVEESTNLLSVRDDFIGLVWQPHVLPPVILYVGLGKERFSGLPGFLGNMLLQALEIERAITSVSTILDIDWEAYFERAVAAIPCRGNDIAGDVRDASKILKALPDALGRAKDNGTGLLGLTCWGSP